MPKVSVIVPIYGVEKYIERCARSLFEQSLDDMEFIFVNDCTKDRSIELLKKVICEYPLRKKSTKIINKSKNQGLSKARETGILYSTGEYICHCDSDDFVEPTAYEDMYKLAKMYDYDIVKAAHFVDYYDKTIVMPVYTQSHSVTNRDVLRYVFSWKGWNSIWSLLVKRSLYENVEFTPYAMLEDFFVTSQLFLKAKKIGYCRSAYYHYIQNPNSICGVKTNDAIINKYRQASYNIRNIIKKLTELQMSEYQTEIIRLKYESLNILTPAMTDYKNYKIWGSEINLSPMEVLSNPYITKNEKLQYLLILLRLYPIFKQLKS